MKDSLHHYCLNLLAQKKSQMRKELAVLNESASADTKSSMGDKYETSREMINLEKGKIAEQLAHADKMLLALRSLDVERRYEKGELGALVSTDTATYFIAVSIGKVQVLEKDIFVLSPISPVGRALLNKRVGDEIVVGGKVSRIQSIL